MILPLDSTSVICYTKVQITKFFERYEEEEYIGLSAREKTVGASLSQKIMEGSLGASARTGNQVEADGRLPRYREVECRSFF